MSVLDAKINEMKEPSASPPALSKASPTTSATRPTRRFYVGMGLTALGIVLVGFGPGLWNTGDRKAPLSLAVGLHAGVFTAWLLLFIAQATLVGRGRMGIHRGLGYVGAALAVLMIVTGYNTAIEMTRRGFDLSGDLDAASDPFGQMVFQLGDLLSFGVLVGAGIWYRRRPEVHKRLLLLATVGSLMGAPLAHLLSHFPALRGTPAILVPLAMLYSAHAVHDRFYRGRIHPVSLWGAIALFVWANLRAAVIGPSTPWREFARWLAS